MQDVTAAAVLRLLPTRPRLLGLGEPTHGENVLLDVRNELFRQLAEEGYRTIAIESDCLAGLVVDDYVTTGAGTLDDVMRRGFSHEWGAFEGNRDLVRWMRAHNDGRPPSEWVRFAGFDGPLEISHAAGPRPVLTALHSYLAARVDAGLLPCTAGELDRLIGADDRWTEPAAMMDPTRSVGRTPEARQLRLLADDLAALLDAQTPQLIAPSAPFAPASAASAQASAASAVSALSSAPDDWDRARLYARTATGLLRYHYWMADTSASRLPWLLGVRDAMMAANLLALAERGPTLVHAHNSHLQRNKSSMRLGDARPEWWSAGAITNAELGDAYAFVATALGTIRHHGVDTPPPDTVEGLLYALPWDRFLVDTRELAAADPQPRVSPWFGYAPLNPAHLAGMDGLVFVKDSPPS